MNCSKLELKFKMQKSKSKKLESPNSRRKKRIWNEKIIKLRNEKSQEEFKINLKFFLINLLFFNSSFEVV